MNVVKEFSVLMSVYFKEKPEYLRDCFESLLNQSVKATEWVVVEDGPLTTELYKVLDEYEKNNPNLIIRVPLKENQGLGRALASGVLHCTNELIARMDTDDIAISNRFEMQLSIFERFPNVDICGSPIIEFSGTTDNVLSKRNVPLHHTDIVKYQHYRSAFNHMTVMYKKSAVLRAGNYEHAPLMEDDLLWVHMILTGSHCCNVDMPLVYARTGYEMIERRGGWAYLKKYYAGRKQILKTGYINTKEFSISVTIQLLVALVPKNIRLWIFTHMLRK